jgi:L-2-hydroxyglutarate oxidase LhgO
LLYETDVAVVGGGVVGLACAAALARAGSSVLVLERDGGLGRGVTSRNSEVLHAGFYYPPGSQKALLCVRGRQLLGERCERLRVPHRFTGKIVVATEADEFPALEALRERGEVNGTPGLELIQAQRVTELEPAVQAPLGLLSPATGIVDAHALTLSFAAEAEAYGAVVLLDTEVAEIARRAEGYRLELRRRGGEREAVLAAVVVNAAGLAADAVAALPQGAGLGIHATLDLAGRIRFGPDAEYVSREDYEVDAAKDAVFWRAIRRYVPSLERRWLAPDFAGLRPKLAGPGEPFRDFVVAEESERDLPGFVNLIGIESPGLTASPAIAERVVALLGS